MKPNLKNVFLVIFSFIFILSCEGGGGLLFEEVKEGGEVLKFGSVSGAVDKTGQPCTPPTSKIVINEMMVDPVNVFDEDGEWIELYNPQGSELNLKNWKIRDNGSDSHVIATDLIVPSGGYVVLCINGDTNANGGVSCDYVYSNFQLVNNADDVVLEDDTGKVIDSVSWGVAAPVGQSFALKNPYLDNKSTTFSWGTSSKVYGTKGEKGTPKGKNEDVYKEYEVSECADGDTCTYDLCEAGKCDNTKKKPDCCKTDADCKDDNPCNKDFCLYSKCRFTTYSVVAGCCSKDSDCNDNDACTKDTCDLQTHKCSYQNVGQGCCTFNAQCADNNPCTFDYCYFTKCYNDLKPDCCVTDAECDDKLSCTKDMCIFNICRHFQIIDGNCCTKDEDCPDDGNPCTSHKCVNGLCQTEEMDICKVKIPYMESFNTAATFGSVGWKIVNISGDATANWIFSVIGNMGPDKFVKFNWSPTKNNVKTVLTSPEIDTSSALLNVKAPKVTVQFEYSYKHHEGLVKFKLVGTAVGDFSNPVILWQKDLNSDVEYDFVNVVLPEQLTGVKTLRIGFLVETDTTFNLETLEIDKVKVAAGVAPELITSLPDQVVTICDKKSIEFTMKDIDYAKAPYIQFPEVSFYGPPLDSPNFISYKKKGKVTEIEYDFVKETFTATLVINPNCIEANAGVYEIGIVMKDGFPGVLESIKKVKVVVLLNKGYLVWSPLGENHPSAEKIKSEISANGRPVQILEDIMLYPDVSKLKGIFGVMGVYGAKRVIKNEEANKLKTYLDGGGKVYIEGGDFFFADPQTPLHPYFNIDPLGDGEQKADGPEEGANFLYNHNFDYSQDAKLNSFIDKIDKKKDANARLIMRNKGAKTYGVVVASDGGTYRTIGSSASFGGFIQKSGGKALKDLMAKYIDFLENGWPKCASYLECEDFVLCTLDSCINDVCKNEKLENCKSCNDDRDCLQAEACVLKPEGNLCGGITGKEFPSGVIDQNFGKSPTKVEHAINVADEGTIEDIQVKVKIFHQYRGDVKITLKHAGLSVVLKNPDVNDSEVGIYQTYDLGVPSPENMNIFNGGPVKGEWRIIVEDTHPLWSNGKFESWSLFSKFSLKVCSVNADCDDNNICTLDECSSGKCKNTIKTCDDGKVCTIDSCDANQGGDGCVHVNNPDILQECYPCVGGTPGVGICKKGSQVCVNGDWGQCSGYVCPETDLCDGIDNDCDGSKDEDYPVGLSCDGPDTDLCKNGTWTCKADKTGVECVNETKENIPETCGNGDEDCDGLIDEEGAVGSEEYYYDGDGDTFGDKKENKPTKFLCKGGDVPQYTTLVDNDCDDNDFEKCPDPNVCPEKCDGKDNDCDEAIDEEGALNCKTYYFDNDDDGYGGVGAASKCLCSGVKPYNSLTNDDCNDNDPSIHPEADELCNAIDDDCDKQIDEECPAVSFTFITPSGLSYGEGSVGTLVSGAGVEGVVGISEGEESGTACDDSPCQVWWGFYSTFGACNTDADCPAGWKCDTNTYICVAEVIIIF